MTFLLQFLGVCVCVCARARACARVCVRALPQSAQCYYCNWRVVMYFFEEVVICTSTLILPVLNLATIHNPRIFVYISISLPCLVFSCFL